MDGDVMHILLQAAAIGFVGVLTALASVLAWVAKRASDQLERLTVSVNELNLKVAEIINSVRITESQLLDHRSRIEKLETKGVKNGTKKAGSRSIQGSA
jgi:hypothetical protein